MSEEQGGGKEQSMIVLDFLPRGRSDDERPQYQKEPLVLGVDTDTFELFELTMEPGESKPIGDEVVLSREVEGVRSIRQISFDDLSRGAMSELEHVIREAINEDEDRFVDVYNSAGPISLRLHQLNLLPGIGDKLRDTILEQREREPFGSLADLESRVSGLHDPAEILIERILEEIRDDDVKYKLFVGSSD
jgi:putative nucleotide binding protein